jgi:hypothetical protein
MFDGDGSAKGDEIPRFVRALQEGADLAKGSRFIGGGGSADITPLRRLGNKFLRGTVNLFFHTSYTDLCYGFNAVWARCLPSLRLDCIGFEFETLLNIRAARAGLEVREVPSYEERRLHGASNLNAVRDGIKILSASRAQSPSSPNPWPETWRRVSTGRETGQARASRAPEANRPDRERKWRTFRGRVRADPASRVRARRFRGRRSRTARGRPTLPVGTRARPPARSAAGRRGRRAPGLRDRARGRHRMGLAHIRRRDRRTPHI